MHSHHMESVDGDVYQWMGTITNTNTTTNTTTNTNTNTTNTNTNTIIENSCVRKHLIYD